MIAEVSFTAALTTLHEKAIYMHEARQFQVEKLDYEGRKAYVRRVDSDYFTDAIDYTQVKELEEFESADMNGARAAHGDVRVNTQVVGFKKLRFYTMENIGAGKLSMPEQELHTTAFWLHFPESFLTRFPDLTPAEKQSGFTGLAQVLRTVAALLLMCDPRDLGIAIIEMFPDWESFEPDVFLYDNYPGGIGQSQPLYELRNKLLDGRAGRTERLRMRDGVSGSWVRWEKWVKRETGCVAPATGTAGALMSRCKCRAQRSGPRFTIVRVWARPRCALADEFVAFQRSGDAGLVSKAHHFSETVQAHFVRHFRELPGSVIIYSTGSPIRSAAPASNRTPTELRLRVSPYSESG